MNQKAVIEGILFVSGSEGITLEELARVLEKNEEQVETLLQELKNDYQSEERGIQLEKYGDLYKLTTKKEHKSFYEKLVFVQDNPNLSQAALETLAIIAYNEPITRMQVDKIRGVSSSQMIRKLVAKGLIKESGRSDLPGRPILYETTNEFLDYFGLSNIDELPDMEKYIDEVKEEKEEEETDLYTSKYKEQ